MTAIAKLRHWMSLQGKVTREEYVLVGVGLMVFKYLVELSVIGTLTGKFYSPLDFVNPLLSARSQFTIGAPQWLGFAWILWTLPFVWIAVAMSMRRSVDAGASPWAAMLILVPIFNFLAMFYLACIPKNYAQRRYQPHSSEENVLDIDSSDIRHAHNMAGVKAAFVGIAVGFGFMFVMLILCIYVFGSYGTALFFGTPLVAGAATAFTYNRQFPQALSKTLALSALTGCCFAASLLLIGLEGLICVAMAAPIMLPLALLGALIGHAVAYQHGTSVEAKERGLYGCLLVLPVFAGVEPHITPQHEFVVMTTVEIAASPEVVWDLVVDFPPITTSEPWYFRAGIASPYEATIDGEGVGAIRHCKFTTGEFVEPITVWDEPRRLAFDVTSQPEPMTELSPYRHIHPPHLDGSFRSTRGEFLLVELPNGNTRLEGRTWYTVDMRPLDYWTVWTDAIVHRIHLRVLEHIKDLAEAELSK